MELIQNNYDQYTLLNQAEQQREVVAEERPVVVRF